MRIRYLRTRETLSGCGFFHRTNGTPFALTRNGTLRTPLTCGRGNMLTNLNCGGVVSVPPPGAFVFFAVCDDDDDDDDEDGDDDDDSSLRAAFVGRGGCFSASGVRSSK